MLRKILKLDILVLLSFAVIVAIGLYYLRSANSAFYAKQIQWIVLGSIALITTFFINYQWLLRQAYSLYMIAFALLIAVLFTQKINGARSWIPLPGGINIQPSEVMKIALVLVLARYLMLRDNQATVKGLIAPFALTLIPLGLILMQPDLGTGVLFPPLLLIMIYCSGARIRHLSVVIISGVLSVVPLWFFVMNSIQKKRVLAFLDPELYSASEAYQQIQSLIAISYGGLHGMGWGKGSQNSLCLLPEKHNDFIFGVIAEEGGFYVSCGLLFAYLCLALAGLHIARKCNEPGGKLLATGVTAIISIQVLINVGVVTAMLPTTGITLPFISYGGSSMLVSFAMIGLLLNVGTSDTLVLGPQKFSGKIK